jgi:hypothetical protein
MPRNPEFRASLKRLGGPTWELSAPDAGTLLHERDDGPFRRVVTVPDRLTARPDLRAWVEATMTAELAQDGITVRFEAPQNELRVESSAKQH